MRLSAGYPDTAGRDAREGSFAHGIAEACLRSEIDAEKMLGAKSRNGEFTVDEEMRAAVQVYLDAVRATMLLEGSKPDDLQVETRVSLPKPVEQIFGTADALVWSRNARRLHVFDFKYGAGVKVEAENNLQLSLYAAAASSTFATRALYSLQNLEVIAHIVQPRHEAGQPWRSAEPRNAAELLNWVRLDVVPAVRAAGAADAELVPGESQCRFCPAKVDCPALRERALEVARDVFADEACREPELPQVDELEVEVVARLLRAGPLVRDYLRAVEARAAELAGAGVAVPGYKLVERTGLRRWNDEAKAEAVLRAADVEPFERPKLLSPAKAEKALGRKRAKLVAELVHKPVTGVVLVPESDKRPAFNAAAAFPSVLD